LKPVLFVTGHVPAYRAGAFAELHRREDIEVALTGGRSLHGGPESVEPAGFPQLSTTPRGLLALAASGRYRAVVCSTSGRLAPVAAWAGARRAGLPLILWASLWAHPRTAGHALTYLPLRRLYASADAVVTYGPHVSAYVAARGARNVHVAPQSVDNDFWRAGGLEGPRLDGWPSDAGVRFLFVGRPAPEKGLSVLREAWRRSAPNRGEAALILVGDHDSMGWPARSSFLGQLDHLALRDVYGACDVLVVPSVATRSFREPWGLVVNEAMNKGLAVIASDAVGAAAGGLVRDGGNGLVVGAGEEEALAGAIERLAGDPALRARLGAAGAEDVLDYSHAAWAEGFSQALGTLGLARDHW
jgi:glycosyltransferase involved in cell wall biosynthesis